MWCITEEVTISVDSWCQICISLLLLKIKRKQNVELLHSKCYTDMTNAPLLITMLQIIRYGGKTGSCSQQNLWAAELLQKPTGMGFNFWSCPQQVRNWDTWKLWYMTNHRAERHSVLLTVKQADSSPGMMSPPWFSNLKGDCSVIKIHLKSLLLFCGCV